MRGATFHQLFQSLHRHHFNPRSPCGERRLTKLWNCKHGTDFNPRSPCGERHDADNAYLRSTAISIHAPHAGSDNSPGFARVILFIFQSTLPMRGATFSAHSNSWVGRFQSTLPMRGATVLCPFSRQLILFQSTLPMRGATLFFYIVCQLILISIHAPHAGSDRPARTIMEMGRLFQSTLPMRGATWPPSFPFGS